MISRTWEREEGGKIKRKSNIRFGSQYEKHACIHVQVHDVKIRFNSIVTVRQNAAYYTDEVVTMSSTLLDSVTLACILLLTDVVEETAGLSLETDIPGSLGVTPTLISESFGVTPELIAEPLGVTLLAIAAFEFKGIRAEI